MAGALLSGLGLLGVLLSLGNKPIPRILLPIFAIGIVQSIMLAAFGQAVVHLSNIEQNTRAFREFVERAANKAVKAGPAVADGESATPETVAEKQIESETAYQGRKVVTYTDGSVLADTVRGPKQFASLEEFKDYIA